MQTDFAEGKNQRRKVENEVFECFCIVIINFHLLKGKEMRSRMVISEFWLRMIQLFCVDEFEGLSPNVVNCTLVLL